MLPRHRVERALAFEEPDVPPAEYHDSSAGLYEHGDALKELWRRYPQDFNFYRDLPIPVPSPQDVDDRGQYRELRTDEWGVVWEHRIFGMAGIPVRRPLDDWRNLATFRPPALPPACGTEFLNEQTRAQTIRQEYFLKSGWIALFEVMHAVRNFEDVLMDLAMDSPEIHRLADLIVEHQLGVVDYLVARGVDAIQMSDDWGTQNETIISPALWRRFFAPRYKQLTARIHAAGKKAFFHSCGQIWNLLEDLAEVGVDAVWPQLQIYDECGLALRCRDLRLAVAVHPDRAGMMTTGTPRQVRQAVHRLAKTFGPSGGWWFNIEIDNGFPFENVQALIETVAEVRGLR